MRKTLQQLAELVDGRLVGDGATNILGVNGIDDAEPGEITFLWNAKYASHLPSTRVAAVLVAGHVGVVDHLEIDDGAIVTAYSGVTKDLKGCEVYSGMPTWPRRQNLRAIAMADRIEETVRALKRRIEELEKSLGGTRE